MLLGLLHGQMNPEEPASSYRSMGRPRKLEAQKDRTPLGETEARRGRPQGKSVSDSGGIFQKKQRLGSKHCKKVIYSLGCKLRRAHSRARAEIGCFALGNHKPIGATATAIWHVQKTGSPLLLTGQFQKRKTFPPPRDVCTTQPPP